jgi:hypothetical protein
MSSWNCKYLPKKSGNYLLKIPIILNNRTNCWVYFRADFHEDDKKWYRRIYKESIYSYSTQEKIELDELKYWWWDEYSTLEEKTKIKLKL